MLRCHRDFNPALLPPSPQLAVGETVILLHPPLTSVAISMAIERGCQQNDSLADGYPQPPCSQAPGRAGHQAPSGARWRRQAGARVRPGAGWCAVGGRPRPRLQSAPIASLDGCAACLWLRCMLVDCGCVPAVHHYREGLQVTQLAPPSNVPPFAGTAASVRSLVPAGQPAAPLACGFPTLTESRCCRLSPLPPRRWCCWRRWTK